MGLDNLVDTDDSEDDTPDYHEDEELQEQVKLLSNTLVKMDSKIEALEEEVSLLRQIVLGELADDEDEGLDWDQFDA